MEEVEKRNKEKSRELKKKILEQKNIITDLKEQNQKNKEENRELLIKMDEGMDAIKQSYEKKIIDLVNKHVTNYFNELENRKFKSN